MKRNLRNQILPNLDLLIGVALAVIVAVLGVIGIVSAGVLSAAVLAVLALQLGVISHLRRQVGVYADLSHDQGPLLRQIHQFLSGRGSVASIYRHEYPDITTEIKEASAIDILAGLSLKTSIAVFSTAIDAALHNGAKIRAVCPNPDNSSLMEAAVTASAHRTESSEAADDVRLNLRLARNLSKTNEQAQGALEIRTIDTLPGVGMIRIQGQDDTHIYLKMMLIGSAWGGYPVLCLNESIDEDLCADVKRSFEAAWRRSMPYE